MSKWKVASAIAAVTGDNPADVRVFFKTDRDLRRVKLPSAASVRAALDEEEVLCDGQEIRINPWDPKPSRGEAASRDSSPSSDERPASGTQTDLRDAEMQQHAIRLHGLACMLKDLSELIMSRWKAPDMSTGSGRSEESEPEMIEENLDTAVADVGGNRLARQASSSAASPVRPPRPS